MRGAPSMEADTGQRDGSFGGIGRRARRASPWLVIMCVLARAAIWLMMGKQVRVDCALDAANTIRRNLERLSHGAHANARPNVCVFCAVVSIVTHCT